MKINNKHKAMNYYEVWGWDTFSYEDYFCGRYASRWLAERVCEKKKEEVAKTQDKELRDTFSIVEISAEGIKKRERENDRIAIEKAQEKTYSQTHLIECVCRLLKSFKDFWETVNLNDLSRNDDESRWLRQKVDWNDNIDCFTQVLFETHVSEDGILAVGIGVVLRGGVHSEGGDITSSCFYSGTLPEILEWSSTEKTLSDCIDKIEKLIDNFFDD